MVLKLFVMLFVVQILYHANRVSFDFIIVKICPKTNAGLHDFLFGDMEWRKWLNFVHMHMTYG